MHFTRKDTEADIAGEVYYRLREHGIIPRLQLKLPSLVTPSKTIIPDLTITEGDQVIAVIEVKRGKMRDVYSAKDFGRMMAFSAQERAYESLSRVNNIPVFWCFGRRGVQPVVDKVLALFER